MFRPSVLLFTDVDGCLLNKHDYTYTDALPVLQKVHEVKWPVILCSSKTASELTVLARELRLSSAPLICENGARILWQGDGFGTERSTVGRIHRDTVLKSLCRLSKDFRFRSFTDLKLEGVMQVTDLSKEAAVRAMDREGTEPILWDDDPTLIADFEHELMREGLTLTLGGRFWHVAGETTKGDAMQEVTKCYGTSVNGVLRTIAIGDSPIDQSMLDRADFPIGIPTPDGTHDVKISSEGMFATMPGAAGWAECVRRLLDQIHAKD